MVPGPHPAAQPGAGGGINIIRQDGTVLPPMPPGLPPPFGAPAAGGPSALPPSPAPSPGRSKFARSHDELSSLLPGDVFHALDTTAGMDTVKRIKLHAACRNTTMAAVLEYTASAPFNHKTSLALS